MSYSFFHIFNINRMFFICTVYCVLQMGHAHAQSQIVALVNDQPITSYELDQRAKLLKLISRNSSRAKALDELIEEKLKLQEAQRRGINVSQQAVDSAFARMAQRAKMNTSQFSQILMRSGVNPTTFKNRIKAEIVWGQVVHMRFRQTVRVDEAEIAANLRNRDADVEEDTIREYTLQNVIFILPKGASDAQVSAAKRAADRFHPTIAGCDALTAQIEGMRDVVVKNIGRRDETQLSPEIQNMLDEINVSQGTKPVRSDQGYEIFVICDSRNIASNQALQQEVRSEMMDEQGRLLERRYIRDLRQDAVIEIR